MNPLAQKKTALGLVLLFLIFTGETCEFSGSGGGGGKSSPKTNGPPSSIPAHLFPKIGAHDQSLTVKLVASTVTAETYPVSYEFELCEDSACKNILEKSESLPYANWFPTAALEPDTTYYWRVQSTDSSNTPVFGVSKPTSFKTIAPKTILYVSPNGKGKECLSDKPCSLGTANRLVEPGTLVYLLEGTYYEPIHPRPESWPTDEKNRIIYLNYPEHEVTISSVDRGFILANPIKAETAVGRTSYVTVSGITFENIKGHWGDIGGDHHVIQNCRFLPYANVQEDQYAGIWLREIGNKNGEKIGTSNFAVIVNNFFDKGCDCSPTHSCDGDPNRSSSTYGQGEAIHTKGGSYSFIQGNHFVRVGHSPINAGPEGGQFGILRDNVFERSHRGFNWNGAYGLVEYNTVRHVGCGDGRKNVFNAGDYVKFDGYRNIYRKNFLIDGEDGNHGTLEEQIVNMGLYPSIENKIYNNLVYGGTHSVGLGMQDHVKDGKVIKTKDNFFFNNVIAFNDQDGTKFGDGDVMKMQVCHYYIGKVPTNSMNYFKGNLFWADDGSDAIIDIEAGPRRASLAQAIRQMPEAFDPTNLQLFPGFINPDRDDFNLRKNSPMVDAGVALTTTSHRGEGTVITVDKKTASFFFGPTKFHPDEPGDMIQVGDQIVRIVRIDYKKDQIQVDRAIEWNDGDAVDLYDFNGSGPDMGPLESPY